ncbi:MAG: glycosyl hydrolase family 8 [Polyangiaceae bacterium]|jgi:endo-1,4-beta-D-glucanase Y
MVLPAFAGCGTSNTGTSYSTGNNQENTSSSNNSGSGTTNGGGTTSNQGQTGTGGNTSNTGNPSAGNTGSNSNPSGSISGQTSSTGSNSNSTGSNSSGVGDAGELASDAGRTCAPASVAVVSDFEEGTDVVTAQGGRTGRWTPYGDGAGPTTTQKANANGVYPASAAPSDDKPGMCNAYALHLSDTGHPMYCGFGAPLDGATAATSWSAYDVSAYDGIQFDIKTGAASQGPVYFEVLTKETQPGPNPPAGSTLTPGSGTATNSAIDAYNNRGYYLAATGTTPTGTGTTVPTSMTTVQVPFSMLIPRYFPSPGAAGCGTATCQAPDFVPSHVLGLQFSVYNDFSTTGAYDLWLDNVTLYNFTSANEGLVPPGMTMPTFNDGKTGWQCGSAMPTFDGGKYTASGKFLLWAYSNWKKNFVAAGPNAGESIVLSPEVNGGAVVSEGIAYGMLLAAYFGDQTLFDGLWAYWSKNPASGTNVLMNWEYNISGSSAVGLGSATDSDEDVAFALLLASHIWPGTASYATNATAVINDIWSHDIDKTSYLPTYGSNAGNSTSSSPTNPSYFAPAYYRLFETTQSGFSTVVTNLYAALNSSAISGSDGLVPAWCSNNCTTVGGGSYANNTEYQYDAHRTPWRVGIDYCWNGAGGSGGASTYLAKVSSFFAGKAAAGIDNLYDEYTTAGLVCTGCTPAAAPNSMSLIGTAAVGAMSGGTTNSAFVSAAWQFVLDGLNRGKPNLLATGNNYYTYYNTTVGLLTALSMSGNFYMP